MSSGGGFFAGLLATLGGGAILIAIGFTLAGTGGGTAETVGLTIVTLVGLLQLAYVIPIFIHAKRTQQEGLRAGLIVGGGLIFLFSAACGGLLLMFSNTNFH